MPNNQSKYRIWTLICLGSSEFDDRWTGVQGPYPVLGESFDGHLVGGQKRLHCQICCFDRHAGELDPPVRAGDPLGKRPPARLDDVEQVEAGGEG